METRWKSIRDVFVFAVVFYGLAGFVLWTYLSERVSGAARGSLIVFSCICLVQGVWIVSRLSKDLVPLLTVGRTWVEAKPAMPAPGEGLHLLLHQKGRLRIRKAELALECLEVVIRGAASDSVREHAKVFQHTVASRENFRSDGTNPLLEGEVVLPADAMHSFRAGSNEILWLVRATLEIAGRPNVNEIFPLAVRPEVVAG